MASKSYNVVIMPSAQAAQAAIAASRFLEGAGSLFTLDGQKLFPHVSLYHVSLPEEALPDVIRSLEAVFSDTPSFPLTQAAYGAGGGIWVHVCYQKDVTIFSLHQRVLGAVNAYRDRETGQTDDGEIKQEDWVGLLPERQSNLQACGWSEAYDLYLPHMTFGRLAAPNAGIINALPPHEFSFQAEQVGLYELGEYGTCTKLICEFPLGKGV